MNLSGEGLSSLKGTVYREKQKFSHEILPTASRWWKVRNRSPQNISVDTFSDTTDVDGKVETGKKISKIPNYFNGVMWFQVVI